MTPCSNLKLVSTYRSLCESESSCVHLVANSQEEVLTGKQADYSVNIVQWSYL